MILGQKTSRNNSHCKLNLRMDGVNDGTTFTDSSPSGNTVNNPGSGTLTKTAIKKFGTASAFFNNSDSKYLDMPYDVDYDFGIGDFTVELWIYPITFSARDVVIGRGYCNPSAAPTNWGIRNSSLTAECVSYINNTGSYVPTLYAGNFALTTWQHIALVRRNGVFQLFNDGIGGSKRTGYEAYVWGDGCSDGIKIGRAQRPNYYFYGYVDSTLITKGKAIYTRNFTPPNRAA